MANIIYTPPTGWAEETGAHVSFKSPCNCTVAGNLVIGSNSYTISDAMGETVTGKGGVFSQGSVLDFVLDCDNRKAFLLNGSAPFKPKLLWSGSWSSGSLTVPGFSDYSFLIAITSSGALGDVPWLMFNTGTAYRVYGGTSSSTAAIIGGRFGSVSGNTLKWGGSSISSITAIYGLVRKVDIQGV